MNNILMCASYYNMIVRPITMISVVEWIYVAGYTSSIDDILDGNRKPIYVNLFRIAKGAAFGALLGVTFPISTPMLLMYQMKNRE